jgi:quercetin dioxygenase-like cupin family protein
MSDGAEAVRLRTQQAPELPRELPAFVPEFVLTRGGAAGAVGRAGMTYRDLIPGRLGGRYIASHITIPEAGPVADWVHYHRVAFQIIVVRRGWVRVVYEDQGAPFTMSQGDVVLQPPGIRHRVLESSAGLEVIEIGAPSLHETFADHELTLPNGAKPERDFGGQRFLRHIAAEMPWVEFRGARAQETAMLDATGGIAAVRTIRTGGAPRIDFEAHDGELVFGFVLKGRARLGGYKIGAADAFVIRPDEPWSLADLSPDLELLQVTTTALDAAVRCPL